MAALKLKDLRTGVAYPLEISQATGKCLIHMKLTDLCSKSIDSLVNSRRGAVFSLRFSDSGGSMLVPLDNEEPRKFQFKTAPIRSDGQNTLECVHQINSGSHNQKLSCTGTIEHRLIVQGNDQIFKSTKEKMKEVELKRKEASAQEITLPTKGNRSKISKTSTLQIKPPERTTPSPTIRKTSKAVPTKTTTTSTTTIGSGASSASKPSGAGGAGGARVSSHTKITAPVRVSHSLKERVVHILALKPQRREEVLDRLKKEVRKNDPSMSAMMDTALTEVSDVSSGNHKLRPDFHTELQVEEWPHYSDAERQLMRRRYGKPTTVITNSTPPPPQPTMKRVLLEPEPEMPLKRVKLEHPLSSSHKQPVVKETSKLPPELPEEPVKHIEPPPTKKQKVKKIKKKRVKEKKDKEPKSVVIKSEPLPTITPNPTSTTRDIPDLKSMFPAIESDHQKADYKQIFSEDYTEYLQLRDSIEADTSQHQKEYAALNDKLNSLPKRCDEASAIRKQIRAKYMEKHQNKELLDNQRRFKELHEKLGHIKKHVVDYDKLKFH